MCSERLFNFPTLVRKLSWSASLSKTRISALRKEHKAPLPFRKDTWIGKYPESPFASNKSVNFYTSPTHIWFVMIWLRSTSRCHLFKVLCKTRLSCFWGQSPIVLGSGLNVFCQNVVMEVFVRPDIGYCCACTGLPAWPEEKSVVLNIVVYLADFFFNFLIFWDRASLCHPGWRTVGWSWLTAALNS